MIFHGFAMENVSETLQNHCFPLITSEISGITNVFAGITSEISRLRRLYNGGVLILSCLQMDIFKGSFDLELIMFSVSLPVPVNTILHKQRAAGEKSF